MDYEQFAARVAERASFDPGQPPERVIESTLEALTELLAPAAAREIAWHLPTALGDVLRRGSGRRDLALAQLYRQIQQRDGSELSRVIERVQVVCAVLGEALGPEVRARLMRELPDDIAELMVPPDRAREAASVVQPKHHAHDLADGRPGGTHPVSESAPGSQRPVSAAQPGLPHKHSVSEANPHADTKVSSAHGLTQQREHESLAEGRSKRP